MVIINKIREHFENDSIEFQVEHFDGDVWKYKCHEIILDIDNISVIYNVQIDQVRIPEEETNSYIEKTPFIDVEIDRVYLDEIEVRLSNQQNFVLENILINAIKVI